jgi:hypothetical protein
MGTEVIKVGLVLSIHRPAIGATRRKRQEGLSEAIKEIAWQAQHRLYRRSCVPMGGRQR